MITRIYADNFRCFSNFTFEPRGMNLLLGENGSGKSSLLDVVGVMRGLARSNDGFFLSPGSLTRWDTRPLQRLELTCVDAHGATYDWTVVIGASEARDRAGIVSETISRDGVVIAERLAEEQVLRLRGKTAPLPYRLDGSILSLRIEDADLRGLHAVVDDIVILKLDVMHFAGDSTRPANLATGGINFASAYRRCRETEFERTAAFHEAMRAVIAGFRSFDWVDYGPETKQLVAKLLTEPGTLDDYAMSFVELSEGQRALAVLYFVVTTFEMRNRSLFFDEPDNYVGLRELQPWLQALTLAVEDRGGQATLVSHSPEVIDYLAADHAWLFERDAGGPARVRPMPLSRDSGLKASEQIARGWVRGA